MPDLPIPAPAAAAARVERFLDERGRRAGAAIQPLTGDASDRRYYRISHPRHGAEVCAVYPGPIEFASMPFANVARLLNAMPVPVPQVRAHSDPLGIVALEDLGDVTLYARLPAASVHERRARYDEAVALIDTLQRRGAELASPDYVPYGLAFDVEKLAWELEFFATHFLGALRGAPADGDWRTQLTSEFAAIAEELAAEPRVLCHRDFHSRNLMLSGGRLYLIDFQDARMGPDTYDLASLLRDSYVDLDPDDLERLIALFLSGRPSQDRGEFRRRFDLMALQRNLKALGTFGYQATSRGNTSYLEAVPRTLAYVRATVRAYPRFTTLHRLLATRLVELR